MAFDLVLASTAVLTILVLFGGQYDWIPAALATLVVAPWPAAANAVSAALGRRP